MKIILLAYLAINMSFCQTPLPLCETSKAFPKVVTGQFSDTWLVGIDYNIDTGKIVVGGYTQDNTLKN